MTSIRPIHDKIILTELETGERTTKAGIIIPDDSTTASGERGIRPRWARVYAVGPEQEDVKVDDWVLMQHGRWTLGQDLDLDGEKVRIWLADPDGILGVSDTKPIE